MATLVNLTINGYDIIGDTFDPRRASAYITTNTPNGIIVVDSTSIRLGGRREKFDTGGQVVYTGLVATNSADNPTSFAYKVTIVYTPIGARQQETWTSSDFTLTATANLAAVSEAFDGLAISPTWQSDFRDEMEDIRDGLVAITGPVDTTVEALIKNTGGVGPLTKTALNNAYLPTLTPEQFGAVGDGVADDTTAVRACFDAANALKRVTGNYYDPGATVNLRNTYKLTTLAAPIDATCNVVDEGGLLMGPSGYTGILLRVGSVDSGKVLQTATISLPKIAGNTVAALGSLPAGSIGVQIRNLYTSRVQVGNITYFETALHVGGESHGVAYNEFTLATMNWYKVGVLIKPLNSGGWANQNTFISGALTGISTFTGGNRATGVRAVVLDGVGTNTVTGNTFIGSAFESSVYEYAIEFKNAYQNQFYGCRHEQGVAAVSTTVSGDTMTSTAHGLTVGNMVLFTGTGTPTGMTLLWPYYVVTVPTADTFKVSAKKGGTPITFTSAGSGVGFYRPPTIHYDKSWDNTIDKPMTPNTWLEQVFTTVTPADVKGNVIKYGHQETVSAHAPATWPVHRARSTQAGAGTKMLWAAYPAATHPDQDPEGWTAALSDKGLHFGASSSETAWVGATSTGALTHQRPADASSGVTYDIPSWRRTGAGTTLTSGTTYTAGTRTTGTASLSGTSVGEYVIWSTTTGLPPRGLTISAQVTATGTITYAIDNNTGANITLASDIILWFAAARRFL